MPGRFYSSVLICTFAFMCGCTQEKDTELAKAKAETETAKAELLQAQADAERARQEVNASKEKAEITPKPVPAKQPASEESRARIISLLEKAAKLGTMTDQGVTLSPYKDQLAEIKSAWDTMSLIGWPSEWEKEQAMLEVAIDAWTLGLRIWETKVGRL